MDVPPVRLDARVGKADIPRYMNPVRFLCLARAASLASVVAVGVAGSLAATGCASDEAAKKGNTGATSSGDQSVGAVRLPDDKFDVSCCNKREFDLNRDGKPDSYQFVKVIDNDPVVVRKENDVNFDGRIDLVRNLSDKGELVEERLDNDFDGRIDLVVSFEKGAIVKKEYDTNFDDKTDLWRYFDKGVINREEADLNYDGRVDYWEYFEAGKLDRVGIDRDADGNVDEWIQSTEQSG
jgi:hypothetical protein